MDEAPSPPPRRNWLAALLVILAIGGSAIGVFIYQMIQSGRKTTVDASGFDIAQTTDKTFVTTDSGQQPADPGSSLGMIKTGLPQMRFGSNSPAPNSGSGGSGGANNGQQNESSFTQMARHYEPQVTDFVKNWGKKSPTLKQYAKDWMSYPDLKKLNDDYMHNHDPIAFARGLAGSSSFPTLVKKYAGTPDMQQFVHAAMSAMPADMRTAGLNYINSDNIVKKVADNVMTSLGLPAGLLGGGGASAPQVDANQVMGNMLGNNPQLQKAMESNPDIQKKIQDATAGQQQH